MRRRSEGGFALLLVLFLVAMLVAVSAQFAFTSQIDRSLSMRHLREAQHEHALWAGFLHAKQLLALDLQKDTEERILNDHAGEPWAKPYEVAIGKAKVSVRIVDEGAKLYLNRLVRPDGQPDPRMRARLERLCDGHPLDGALRDDLVEALIDWMDRNPDGAEEGRFESGAKNAELYTTRELLGVPGWTRRILYGYRDPRDKWIPGLAAHLSAWGDGWANANLAGFEVLKSLSSRMDDDKANAILRERAKKPFETAADWQQITEIQGDPQLRAELATALRVNSVFFSVRLDSRVAAEAEEGEAQEEGSQERPSVKRAIAYAVRLPAGVELLFWDAEPLPTE